MTNTTRDRSNTTRSRGPRQAPGRPTQSRGVPSTPHSPARRGWIAAAAALAAGVGIAGGAVALGRDDDGGVAGAAPYVGGDLHVLASVQDRLYVGGHDGAAVSNDGGLTWAELASLRGADPMGWAQAGDTMLVGGHPGLYRSTDGGTSFTQLTGDAQVPDVHALGAAADTAYLASPQAGLLASTDGGATWQPRNAQVGQGFMGTILVDPSDPLRLIAPDMANGLVTSSDGGSSWTRLGGPDGAMAAAWDPTNTSRLVAVGMSGSAISVDAGQSWAPLEVPEGTSAATFSSDGQTLYAAALDGDTAITYASTDTGASWTQL